jgi:hypothetical protein
MFLTASKFKYSEAFGILDIPGMDEKSVTPPVLYSTTFLSEGMLIYHPHIPINVA